MLRKEAYSAKETAAMLGLHVNTIYNWVARGLIPHRRVRRKILIPRWAVANLLALRGEDNAGAPSAPAGGGDGGGDN